SFYNSTIFPTSPDMSQINSLLFCHFTCQWRNKDSFPLVVGSFCGRRCLVFFLLSCTYRCWFLFLLFSGFFFFFSFSFSFSLLRHFFSLDTGHIISFRSTNGKKCIYRSRFSFMDSYFE